VQRLPATGPSILQQQSLVGPTICGRALMLTNSELVKEGDVLTLSRANRRMLKIWAGVVAACVLLLPWRGIASARTAGQLLGQTAGAAIAPASSPAVRKTAPGPKVRSLALMPPLAAAESQLEKQPSLEAVEQYARAYNPAIHAAFAAWRAAESRITVERSYENPMVGYMPDTRNMAETRAGPQTNGVAVSQVIPFPGKLTLKGEIAGRQAKAAREKLEAVIQETMRKVRRSYADFYYAERGLKVNADTIVLARQFEEIADAKYQVGKVPEQDVIQAQEILSRLTTQTVDFTQQSNGASGALNTLLDRAPRAPLGKPAAMAASELKVPLKQLVEEARRARPEIRAENDLVRARERAETLAKMGYLPDFSIGGQYIGIDGHDGVPGFNKDGHDIWAVALGFSVPIWVDRVKARVDEAGAHVIQQRFARRNLVDVVNDQIQDAYERLMGAARDEAIYRTTLLPQTAERARAAEAGYQTGVVDFLTLIDSLKSYEDVRLLRYKSVRDYQIAAADLIRAVGKPIAGIAR
jgi:outer membrane protein, heavy metal efflux system